MSQTNPLGRFTLAQAFSRVKNRSAQIEGVQIGDGSIASMVKGRLMQVFSLGSAALKDSYYGPLNITLTGVSSGVSQVIGRTLSNVENISDVREVTSLLRNKYNPAASMSALSNYVVDYDHATYGRHFYFAPNDASIYIMQGSSIAGTENALTLWIIGYPYVGWTLDDVNAGVQRIDCPDWIYPWVTLGAAVDCLYEANAQMNGAMGGQLLRDYDMVVDTLDKKIKAENEELSARGRGK